mmetsp:Transcript_10043/g.41424  ORF Transcript_10043/g.41424 Transcript_10043/m.41424 type:complete len:629 (-) Transcript_10043:181-2067(-)
MLGFLLQRLVQLAPVAVLEHKVQVRLGLKRRVQRRDEGVIHRFQNLTLRPDPVQLVPVVHLLLDQYLHREQPVGPHELDQVDAAHVAVAQPLQRRKIIRRQPSDPSLRLVLVHRSLERRPVGIVPLVRLRGPQDADHVLPGQVPVLQSGDARRDRARRLLRVLLHLSIERALVPVPVFLHEVQAGGVILALLAGVHRDVHLNTREEADVSLLVPHRRHGEHVPKRLPLLGVVQQPDGALAALVDRLANLRHRAPIGPRTLKEPAVPPQDLLAGVPGEVQKPIRREDDWAVGQRRVGDDEGLLDALQGGGHVEASSARRYRVCVEVDALARQHRLLHVVHPVEVLILQPLIVLDEQGETFGVLQRRALRVALGPVADVHLHADELGDGPVRQLDRRDGEQVPELLAILAVIEQADGDPLALLDRPGYLAHVVHVRLLPLEEPAVAVEDLLGGVSGHLQEPVRRVDDGAVRERRVAHGEGVAERGERVRQVLARLRRADAAAGVHREADVDALVRLGLVEFWNLIRRLSRRGLDGGSRLAHRPVGSIPSSSYLAIDAPNPSDRPTALRCRRRTVSIHKKRPGPQLDALDTLLTEPSVTSRSEWRPARSPLRRFADWTANKNSLRKAAGND